MDLLRYIPLSCIVVSFVPSHVGSFRVDVYQGNYTVFYKVNHIFE